MNRTVLAAALALALVTPAQAKAPPAQPVTVGAGAELDACPSLGAIISLRRGGDGFLAVRAASSVKARTLDKLKPGRELLLCQDSADGKWVEVVYPEPFGGAGPGDCGVSEVQGGPARPYDGVCLWGWVLKAYVEVIAG
jgi:hypothetical protein